MGNQYKNADFWLRDDKLIQSDFLCRPQSINALGDVNGKNILDIGCGEGYVCRILTRKGAKVIGIDNSKEMIAKATEMETKKPLGISYSLGDATKLEFEDKSFDKAISICVTPHLNKKETLKHFKEAFRVLKTNGLFVIGCPHPTSWKEMYHSPWWPLRYKKEEFDCNKPMPCTLVASNGTKFDVEGIPHTEEEYEKDLAEAGFCIKEKIEPLATPEDMKHFSGLWGEEAEKAFYLIYKCEKPNK